MYKRQTWNSANEEAFSERTGKDRKARKAFIRKRKKGADRESHYAHMLMVTRHLGYMCVRYEHKYLCVGYNNVDLKKNVTHLSPTSELLPQMNYDLYSPPRSR